MKCIINTAFKNNYITLMKLKSHIMKASERKQRDFEFKKKILDRAMIEYRKRMQEEYEAADRHNKKCPHCGGTKINDRIRDMNGSFGSFWGGGSIQSEPVNKCNDCGHEWKKYVHYFQTPRDIIRGEILTVISVLNAKTPFYDELYRGIPISLFKDMVKDYCPDSRYEIPGRVMRRRFLLKAGFIR